ncbi:MAG: type III-B CRISPR module RAMP protein Cmr1 [Gallionella sp.]|nr:type III-B CRISPR module RAMP protein Cmr1 [Gallionella sp.]
MAKRVPSTLDPEKLEAQLESSPTNWKTYKCTLVTPMYGGGVKTGEVDADMPIRAAEIRGQLRFWWRLLNRNLDSKTMFQQEREIWGGLGDEQLLAASMVVVKLSEFSVPKLEACASYPPGKSYPKWADWANAYVLFPAQGNAARGEVEQEPGKLAREGLSCELHIGYRHLPADVAKREQITKSVGEAFRWWATFGGMGARSRRGLGAVEIEELSEKRLFNYVTVDEVAQAGMQLVLRKPVKKAADAWQQAVNAMRDFRQGEGIGRNKGQQPNRPGRSRWPEPASIRKTVGVHRIKEGGISFAPDQNAEIIFPRAAFGLPIIFHFQNDKTDQKNDPGDTQLIPMIDGKDQERMASPLILRPYRTAAGWCPAVLKLPEDNLLRMDLKLENSGKGRSSNLPKITTAGKWWPQDNSAKASKVALIEPMKERGNDALSAFLKYFESGAAGAVGEATQAIQIAEKVELIWEKAQVKFNKANGALTVEKDGKSATAIKPASDVILKNLSSNAQQKIQTGQFFRATATINGTELLKLEETK